MQKNINPKGNILAQVKCAMPKNVFSPGATPEASAAAADAALTSGRQAVIRLL